MAKEELALLLGMLCGDGCLTISTKSKGGYKCYATDFCNSNLDLIHNFQNLFLNIFDIKGNYYSDKRKNKKKITYTFRNYSREVFNKIAKWGFPVGLKKYKLRIPQIIWNSNKKEKLLFLKGFIITDGSIKKSGSVVFHIASKRFLEDISDLIDELFNLRKPIKEYLQKEKFYSYQLFLNKKQAQIVLNS
ncbi:MAG: LAGLIDADG family homing endonuclease [archaeon]